MLSLSVSSISYKGKREGKREEERERERKREEGRKKRKREKMMSRVNYYQSAFNSQKEKEIYWQKYSKFQKVAADL